MKQPLFPRIGPLLLLVGVMGLCPAPLPAAAPVAEAVVQNEQQRIEAIARASQATIAVFGGHETSAGGGSGVVITPDGYALTNYHVSKPCGNYMKCGMNDGRLYDAVIVGVDPTGDVALIKLLGREDFPTAEMGDSDQLQVGDWCFAVGNPFLLATDFHPTVTYGIVSGVHRYQYPAGTLLEYTDCIQTDAAINPGNSGGPLFNAQGQLVGINGRGSFEKRGRVNVGVGYAISINQVKNFLGYLHSGRIVDHATLGASVATDDEGRVVVTNILESSDVYRRGVRYGDEVVAFAGRPITTANDLKNVLGIFPKGWRLPLVYRRDGQRHEVLVRLAGVHTHEELIRKTTGVQEMELPEGHPQPEQDPPPGDPQPQDAEDEQPQEDPQDPQRPLPKLQSPQKKPLPEEVAPFYTERRGYANYHFNQLQLDRVWEAFQKQGDFTSFPGRWTLQGQLAGGGAVQLQLEDQQVQGHWNEIPITLNRSEPLETQLAPPQSGGAVLGLFLWRRFLTEGPERFGEVYYLGTAPLPGEPDLVDVVVGIFDVVECRFYFDRQHGQLLALEVFPDSEVDPCELYFRDYRSVDGRQVPAELEIICGPQSVATLQIEAVQMNGQTPDGT